MYKIKKENIIIGAGIAGCSLAYFLSKYSKDILLIDKNDDVAGSASGAAGAFLSPLLGKPNKFKDLVTKAIVFSTNLYKSITPDDITNCGTCRIPKNKEDEEKFESYKPYMDFEYTQSAEGYIFPMGSVVNSYNICKKLTQNIETKFDYDVFDIKRVDDSWIINDEIECRNLFLCTGADVSLIDEEYVNIRPVWGQKIDVIADVENNINYHKECSLSISKKVDGKNVVSIGATHHRFENDMSDTSYNLKLANINKTEHNVATKKIIDEDCEKLIKLANEIKSLGNVEVIDVKIGARSASFDYFPMVGKLIDSKKSFEKFPHLLNGSFIKDEMLEMIDNLYIINGVGGRGYVLSPYLANNLVENLYNNNPIDEEIINSRLFKRWAKRVKSKNK